MKCPHCDNEDLVVDLEKGSETGDPVSWYACGKCGKIYVSGETRDEEYSLMNLLKTLELHNRGLTDVEISDVLRKESGEEIPSELIHSWLDVLRRGEKFHVRNGPDGKGKRTMIMSLDLPMGDGSPFRYRTNNFKALSERYPELLNYMLWISNDFPWKGLSILQEGDHAPCSERFRMKRNDDAFGDFMDLLRSMHGESHEPESVRDFFFLMHPDCVAVSLPVFTDPADHKGSYLYLIDILLLRESGIHLINLKDSPTEGDLAECLQRKSAFIKRSDVPSRMVECSVIIDGEVFDLEEI